MRIRFLKASFYFNSKRFTLGGVNLYRGKKAAYNQETVKAAALDPNRSFTSEKYNVFPIVNERGLTIWAKGTNGDTHIIRRVLDAHVAEKLIAESEAMFATYKK